MTSQDDIVIAVMGTTGTGKSSFIQSLSGDTNVHIGDNLESETEDVHIVPFHDPVSGRNVTLVDTPGFDDSRSDITDTDILEKIIDFLLTEFDNNRKLNGLVYLQRISDPRFSGQSRRNLRMFRNLCGTNAYENVVVLTTFWDQVTSREEGVKREQQLKTIFFQDLDEGGAHFMRHDRTIESAHEVLQHILTLVPTNVQVQEEIRMEGKTLEETAAGSIPEEEMARMIEKHKNEMAEVRIELRRMRNRKRHTEHRLRRQRNKLKRELAQWEAKRTELQRGLGKAKGVHDRLRANLEKERRKIEEEGKSRESKLVAQRRDHENRMRELQSQLDQARQRAENAKKGGGCIIC